VGWCAGCIIIYLLWWGLLEWVVVLIYYLCYIDYWSLVFSVGGVGVLCCGVYCRLFIIIILLLLLDVLLGLSDTCGGVGIIYVVYSLSYYVCLYLYYSLKLLFVIVLLILLLSVVRGVLCTAMLVQVLWVLCGGCCMCLMLSWPLVVIMARIRVWRFMKMLCW